MTPVFEKGDKCVNCGTPAVSGFLCGKCAKLARENRLYAFEARKMPKLLSNGTKGKTVTQRAYPDNEPSANYEAKKIGYVQDLALGEVGFIAKFTLVKDGHGSIYIPKGALVVDGKAASYTVKIMRASKGYVIFEETLPKDVHLLDSATVLMNDYFFADLVAEH
ncbi:hypothetical protein A2619_02965 [candidate division WWE3 bacterium RIFOXYD1_FULL_39_9]|uniref:Uncharacterized protein n=1 Tax=candidate division WWE3 bacterium RIFOXYD1_FULL_39_9 TaxID=1802649 RepID=A0A1F4X8J2_UNCKA|nr:MAG: hypothetical protein A2619_02965 [candidate division WWE3 bacterium RIFOXYD1_FULL_39_9]